MKIQILPFLIFALIWVTSCSDKDQLEEKPPNIILILADDLGVDDLGIKNSAINTPYLNQLSKEALSFEQFYVNTVCAPSRASLLTGRHFLRTGVSHVHGGKDFIHLDETLLPQTLKLNGYTTGMWGKWHSGHSIGYFPWERGFDEAYMADLYNHANSSGLYNGIRANHEKWSDEVIIDYAIDFVSKNKDAPFFAFIPSLTPHTPIKAPQKIIDNYVTQGYSKNLSALYAMIEFMDSQLGRLFNHLDSLGISDNTIIIFLSDNGPQISTGFLTKEERQERYVSNLKGHKGDIWENGVRSPLFIKWPKKLNPQTVKNISNITDLYPTLIDLAGGNYPKNQLALDGKSLAPLIMGEGCLSKAYIFDFAHYGWAPSDEIPYTLEGMKNEYAPFPGDTISFGNQILSIRDEQFKFMHNPQSQEEYNFKEKGFLLFDLSLDPTEDVDVSNDYPDKIALYKELLKDWFYDIKASPHLFARPIFKIDSSSTQEGKIWTNGAVANSGDLTNSALELKNWKHKSWATYNVEFLTGGTFYPEFKYQKSLCSCPVKMRITMGDIIWEGNLNDAHTCSKPLKIDKGSYLLKIETTKYPDCDCDILLDALRNMTFQKV